MFDRNNSNWIQTVSGKQFWPLNPKPEDIDINDIAHALSMKCRFGGHCTKFYSIAQHSIMVSSLVPEKDALWGLLHDAAEAYLADIPSPVKKCLPDFKDIEDTLLKCILNRFGLSTSMPESVKEADLIMLATEARDLMVKPPVGWSNLESIKPLDVPIDNPLRWETAKDYFLMRFNRFHKN